MHSRTSAQQAGKPATGMSAGWQTLLGKRTWQHVRLPHSQLILEVSEAQQRRSARMHITE